MSSFSCRGVKFGPIAASELRNAQAAALNEWLETARISEGVIISDIWQSRVPKTPVLANEYFEVQQPSTVDPTTGQ